MSHVGCSPEVPGQQGGWEDGLELGASLDPQEGGFGLGCWRGLEGEEADGADSA